MARKNGAKMARKNGAKNGQNGAKMLATEFWTI